MGRSTFWGDRGPISVFRDLTILFIVKPSLGGGACIIYFRFSLPLLRARVYQYNNGKWSRVLLDLRLNGIRQPRQRRAGSGIDGLGPRYFFILFNLTYRLKNDVTRVDVERRCCRRERTEKNKKKSTRILPYTKNTGARSRTYIRFGI